jgi:aspartyl-tRNA(Asn)/glutamyl-tRNA(Gln) amidotransferase subunit A
LTQGFLPCTARVRQQLRSIEALEDLNAFLSVYSDEALAVARRVDATPNPGKLAGMTIGLKDVLAYRNHPLQAASRILDGYTSSYTATAVQRLLDEDAVILGRQNCDEFGMGSSTENSAFGPTKNPVDTTRSPGGSSGGSAAAVAAGLCDAALGSDTGGSVRQPAAFCGIYGLKPTYGRVSRYGLVAYASSFDTVGILARSPADTARILNVIAGADAYDSTVSQKPVPDYLALLGQERKFRVGVVTSMVESPALQPEVKAAIQRAVNSMRKQGHEVTTMSFPLLDYLLPAYYILATAEASSNLSRYDGVRYGYRHPDADDLESMYKKTRTAGFGSEVLRRILLGTFVLSSDYHDAYYAKAQRVRQLIRLETKRLLREVDVLLMPTCPTTAFQLGSGTSPVSRYLADIFSVQANVAGVPALSMPYGTDDNGLPIGLQAMADDFNEGLLLQLARVLSIDR